MSDKVNIQNEIQKIHAKYGTTEKANYEIQKFCKSYADQEKKAYLKEMLEISQETIDEASFHRFKEETYCLPKRIGFEAGVQCTLTHLKQTKG